MPPDKPKRAEPDKSEHTQSQERVRISEGPKRTLMQWKPPAAATQQGLSVERVILARNIPAHTAQAPGLAQGFAQPFQQGAMPPPLPAGEHALNEAGRADAEAQAMADARTSPEAYAKTQEPAGLSLPPPAPLSVGDIVGDRYVVEQHISSGGFGSVYRASDKQISNHQVALKLLHKPAASEEERESALRELTLIASVSHPSVVQFKDYGWRDGCLWFAMPWYRGHTLAERLEGLGDGSGPVAMKRTEAHPIFERLAQGLAAMHDVGIYHHDIKPENVFLADIAGFSGGLPVLLDLGISTKRGEKPKGLTIEYAAPETAAAALGEPIGPVAAPADVFSLALVLRNALEPSTAPPLDADNALAILQRRANEPVAPPSSRDVRYLKPEFQRWLSLDPAVRPTAEELAREFAQLIEPEETRKTRVRFLRRLIPVVLIAALLVAGLYYQNRKQATVLIEQGKELTKEKQESEQIRRESESQLKALETRNETVLGTERQRLEEAIGIARNLDRQLARAERESDTLTKRVERLADDKGKLNAEKNALTTERDTLTRTRDQLSNERDNLVNDRNRLSAERTMLIGERDELDRRANALTRERDTLASDLASRKAELSLTKSELKSIEAEVASLRSERKELNKRVSDLQEERDRVEAIRRSLERQLSQQERTKPSTGGTSTATPSGSTGSGGGSAQPSDPPIKKPRVANPDATQSGSTWR